MQEVIIAGRLVRNPANAGKAVYCTIATTAWGNDVFLDICATGKTGELLAKRAKGDLIAIKGELSIEKEKIDGEWRIKRANVLVSYCHTLLKKNGNYSESESQPDLDDFPGSDSELDDPGF